MIITPFGLAYLPVVAGILLLRRDWLLPLLIVSATLHAPAVVVIAGMGLTPWLVTAGAAILHLLFLVRQRGVETAKSTLAGRLLRGWMVFLAICTCSAFTLPFLFAGMETFSLQNLYGFAVPPEPLQWRFANAVMACHAVLMALLLVYVVQIAGHAGFRRRVLAGFAIAMAAALALSAAQRMQTLGILPVDLLGDSLNPSYAHNTGGWLAHFPRLSWPYSEPSYASVWFAACFSAGLAMALFASRVMAGTVLVVLGLLGIVNSMGGSGIASVAITSVLLGAFAVFAMLRARREQAHRYAKRLAALSALALCFAGLLVGVIELLQKDERFAELSLDNFYTGIILPRINNDQYTHLTGLSRSFADRKAMEIVAATHGLGAGLGSNRSASFLPTIASNVGIVPTILLLGLLFVQFRSLGRRHPTDEVALLVFGGATGIFVGMLVGIPDAFWPACWIWIIVSLGLLVDADPRHSAPACPQGS